MIAVLIPAHNEETLIGACLQSVSAAARHPALFGESVEIIVALDRCVDGTAGIVAQYSAHAVRLTEGNVGLARAAAAARALELGARWLALTDADTRVPDDWLAAQLAAGAEAFCGAVTVDDWEDYSVGMAVAFVGSELVQDGHPHIHGANMGISARSYLRCGGFQPLAVSEDVALIRSLEALGLPIARLAKPLVRTSARRNARAVGGFSDYLKGMEARLAFAGDAAPAAG